MGSREEWKVLGKCFMMDGWIVIGFIGMLGNGLHILPTHLVLIPKQIKTAIFPLITLHTSQTNSTYFLAFPSLPISFAPRYPHNKFLVDVNPYI